MDILFLPSWFESNDEPNAGSFFVEQAKTLQSMGHSVVVAIVDIVNYPYRSVDKRFRIINENRHGLEIYRIKLPSYLTGHFPGLFYRYYGHYYNKLIKKIFNDGYKFDVIYAHSFWHAGYIATKIKKKYRLPLIVQEHRSILITNEVGNNVNKYLKKTIVESNAFYCVSNRLKNNIVNRVGVSDLIGILPNMVDDYFKFYPLEKKGMFSFCFVGRLIELKRVYQLARCFYSTFGNNEKVELNIAGVGPLEEQIKQFINDNKVKNIHLLGNLSRDGVANLLRNSNTLVLTSEVETFGLVYAESLCTGRPVIGSRNGGAQDIIKKDNGILVDIDNDSQLCDALRHMYENYSNYDLKAIAENAINTYSKEVVMNRVVKDMRRVIADEK